MKMRPITACSDFEWSWIILNDNELWRTKMKYSIGSKRTSNTKYDWKVRISSSTVCPLLNRIDRIEHKIKQIVIIMIILNKKYQKNLFQSKHNEWMI